MWTTYADEEKVNSRKGNGLHILASYKDTIRKIMTWWIQFNTGMEVEEVITKYPMMPLFVHFSNLYFHADTLKQEIIDARVDPNVYELYRPTSQSVCGQMKAMFNPKPGTDAPKEYDAYKHLSHMTNMSGLTPTALRRSQITIQVIRNCK